MSLKSLIASGTKLWLDGVEPDLIRKNRALGATGATSNPIIITKIIKSGQFDETIRDLIAEGKDDNEVAWALADRLVSDAQQVFLPAWEQTHGDDGYVSFELDPLLEDAGAPPRDERIRRYIELAKRWSAGHRNRMIKVPATAAGIGAMEGIAAAGVTINVTLIFTERQYRAARDAIWRGAQRRAGGLNHFKSVYSIFISRVDVYTQKHVPQLSAGAQGLVGICNAKSIWRENAGWWADKKLALKQEIVFASTGVKNPTDPADKYVEALAGSDIQTNPPETNDAVEQSGKSYTRKVDVMPAKSVVEEIAAKVDQQVMEELLMSEGITKFTDPQKALLKLIAEKRKAG